MDCRSGRKTVAVGEEVAVVRRWPLERFDCRLLFLSNLIEYLLRLCVGNSSVDKIYIIRPKPGSVAKNTTPRPSGWESNPRPLDY